MATTQTTASFRTAGGVRITRTIEELSLDDPLAAIDSSPPGKPSDNIEGQWRDGYEVLEYPSESGSWSWQGWF